MKISNSTENKISKINEVESNNQNKEKNINNSQHVIKQKKKPTFNIPIFQINMKYYEIKKRAKNKNGKEKHINSFNFFPINKNNNIFQQNINKTNNINNNNKNNKNQDNEKCFFYEPEDSKELNNDDDKKSITNINNIPYNNIPFDFNLLNTNTDDANDFRPDIKSTKSINNSINLNQQQNYIGGNACDQAFLQNKQLQMINPLLFNTNNYNNLNNFENNSFHNFLNNCNTINSPNNMNFLQLISLMNNMNLNRNNNPLNNLQQLYLMNSMNLIGQNYPLNLQNINQLNHMNINDNLIGNSINQLNLMNMNGINNINQLNQLNDMNKINNYMNYMNNINGINNNINNINSNNINNNNINKIKDFINVNNTNNDLNMMALLSKMNEQNKNNQEFTITHKITQNTPQGEYEVKYTSSFVKNNNN